MRILFIGICLIISQFSTAQSVRDSLSLELENIINNSEIPGLGVSIVGEEGILYSRGFGFRDLEHKKPYDSITIQSVASISKTIIAVSIMKLVEEGKVKLDDNINTYLPFKVINPHFPDAKITLLQLATHTSSIIETDQVDDGSYYIIEKNAAKKEFPKGYYKYYKTHLKNKDTAIEDYLRTYLSVDGVKFKKNIFGKYKPGEYYHYSNIASTLVAYIIEKVSNQSFEDFTKNFIFSHLEMKNTTWKQPNSLNFATQYFHNGFRVPDYSLITFPAGDLQTNSYDMAKFMLEMMNGYNGKGTLLNKTSYECMFANQLNVKGIERRQGIFWNINPESNIGHGGAEIGTTCQVIFSPSLMKSFFLMINMSVYDQEHLEKDYINLLITISEYAKKL